MTSLEARSAARRAAREAREVLTEREVAERLRCSIGQARHALQVAGVHVIELSPRCWRVSRERFERFVVGGCRPAIVSHPRPGDGRRP